MTDASRASASADVSASTPGRSEPGIVADPASAAASPHSDDRRSRSERRLDVSLDRLDTVVALAEGRLSPAALDSATAVLDRARTRSTVTGEHTVVGLFGATGSGKSSMFNALTGTTAALTHVKRPTTSEPLVAVYGDEGSDAVLEWLGSPASIHPTTPFADEVGLKLAIVDLPDFDSYQAKHRDVAQEFASRVDVLLWIVDPQKYADAVLHNDFIAPLRSHAGVTAVILNQIDLLDDNERQIVHDSLVALLNADGVDSPVLSASAISGDGLRDVRALVTRFARRKQARITRLRADIAAAIDRIDSEVHGPDSRPEVASSADSAAPALVATLVTALEEAIETDLIASTVSDSFRMRANRRARFPLAGIWSRNGQDPLDSLTLPNTQHAAPRVLAPLGADQRSRVSQAIASATAPVVAALPEGWRREAEQRTDAAGERVSAAVDASRSRTQIDTRPGAAFNALAIAQWLALGMGIAGLVWLMAALVTENVGSSEQPGWVANWMAPVLLIGVAITMAVIAALIRATVVRSMARRRGQRVRDDTHASLKTLATDEVVAQLDQVARAHHQFDEALNAAKE